MNKNIIFAIVAAIIVIGGGYFVLKGGFNSKSQNAPVVVNNTQEPTATTNNDQPTTEVSVMQPTEGKMESGAVSYTGEGFQPSSITIKVGQTVTWTNKDSDEMWVASNQHPVHSGYDGTTLQEHCANPTSTTFDECMGVATGKTYSFTFTKAGTWGYHNHMNPSNQGTVIVTQ